MQFNKPYNRQEFVDFLHNSFMPEDFDVETSKVMFWNKMSYAESAVRLGRCRSLDLVVYEVRHNSLHDARVGMSRDAFRMLADEKQSRALVAFIPNDDSGNYRLSLIEIELSIDDESSNVKRTFSNPRRYSFMLGEGIACYTPNKYLNEKGRVESVKDLHERFSVEKLTNDFYNELSDWYAWAINIIRFPNDITTMFDAQKYNQEGAIRLITRLIFVWFLKQRGLIPWQFFDEQYIADNLIDGFNPHAETNLFGKSYESKYYKAILQNLFFAMLNCPITKEGSVELTERRFKDGRGGFDDNKLMRYRSLFKDPDLFLELANKTVPFLNGGLFDCLDQKREGMYYDGFSERTDSMKQLSVPDFLFFGEEAGRDIDLSEWYGDKNKKKVSARGIIDILKRYNFTVEENMPFDKDVSLDPELLGKVFENLLAAYNPETQQTARKQTGSFYTPREIVQYMVDESLVAHLKRTVGEELEAEYRKLLSYTDEEANLTDGQKQQIMQSLYNCKILDPACGSGAFPVGILQQMVHILTQIDPDNSQWKEMLLNQAISETSDAYRNASPEERAEMVADIERSFDESVNRPDYARKLYLIENCIYGVDIQAIAIQISKLRFFISLVVDQKINNNPADNFGIRPLPNLEAKFVAANSLIGLKGDLTLADSDDIVKETKKKLKLARHRIFSARSSRTKQKYKQEVNELREALAKAMFDLGFVNESEAQQLSAWDMFDQNASSPFFDPDWMFGVKGGFDIVIANPPYIDSENMVNQGMESLRKSLIQRFDYLSGNWDMYMAFLELSVKLSHIVSFITPDKWLSKPFGEKFREHVVRKRLSTITHAGAKVFDSVTVDAIITLFVDNANSLISNKFRDKRILERINNISIKDLPKPYLIDFLFSHDSYIIIKIDDTDSNISRLGLECEGACATSDAYKLLPLIESDSNPNLKDKYKLINTGTLVKYGNLWGIKPITYLGLKEIYPVVDKSAFNFNFGLTYIKRALRKKLIFKGLNLLDVYPDLNGEFIPGKTTLVICSDNVDMLKMLCGLLNSKLIYWYLKIKFSSNSYCGGITFTKDMINNISIPSERYDFDSRMIQLVDRILSIKYTNQLADTSAEEREIDLLVYKLYGLTYEEIKIIDPETDITEDEYK